MTMTKVYLQKYDDFPVNEKEILRYAGCGEVDTDSQSYRLMRQTVDEVINAKALSYNISYCICPLDIIKAGEDVYEHDFGQLRVLSRDLYRCLKDCNYAVLFAATLGHGIDRYIHRYSKIQPARALFLQGLGAERIETMLDGFMLDIENIVTNVLGARPKRITPRYSPGFGDVGLNIQPDFLKAVDASRRLGITLNDSLLMSPSKSVTAFVGIEM